MDDKLRQSIMGLDKIYNEGGAYYFTDMEIETLNELAANNFVDLSEQLGDNQSCYPTISETIEWINKYNEPVCLIGYIISPAREDYRLSIEGFRSFSEDENYMRGFVKMFHHADAFICKNGYQYCWYH